MKKVKKILLTFAFLALLTIITSCGDSTGKSNGGDSSIENSIIVSKFEHGVVKNDGDDLSKDTTISGNLNAGQIYYLIMKVKYYANCDTDGMQIIQANLKLYNITVVEGKLDSANSSEAKTINFTNSTDETDCMQTTIEFKIPEIKEQETDMEIKIKLTPRFPVGTTENLADCRVALNVSSRYKITGAMTNGTTFTLHVAKTKIGMPEITWNKQKFTLQWIHVAYADKYEIYFDDDMEPVTIYTVPAQYSTGDEIIYSNIPTLVKDATEEIRIRIRAVANVDNTGLIPAENYEPTFSNSIFITI